MLVEIEKDDKRRRRMMMDAEEKKIRRAVFAILRKLGYRKEYASKSGSVYYRCRLADSPLCNEVFRVSDHSLPLTENRMRFGYKATFDREIIIDWESKMEWVIETLQEVFLGDWHGNDWSDRPAFKAELEALFTK